MPVDFTEAIAPAAGDLIPRKRWTRAECKTLSETGLFEVKNLELIDGELIDKRMGKNRPHVTAVLRLQKWLAACFGFDYVQVEGPIDVAPDDFSRNEPEPDLAVLRQPVDTFSEGNPKPADIVLAVEVADSTLPLDLSKKLSLYGRAGISEYWVLDVKLRRMIVHREPRNGGYGSVKSYSEHESVSPQGAPDAEFKVSQAFAD